MNCKIISLIAAALIATASAQRPEGSGSEDPDPKPELPECTIGVDTTACTTPFGNDGYFVHLVFDDEQTVTSRLRPTGAPGGGRPTGAPEGGDETVTSSLRPTSAPGDGDETVTSSLRPTSAPGGGRPTGAPGGGFGGSVGGGRPGASSPENRMGRHGGKRLNSSTCVPIDAPEPRNRDGDMMGGRDVDASKPPQLQCGCEDDVCPTIISCGCACEITLPYGATMQGTKATITRVNGSTMNLCVPPVYAVPDMLTCITDCSVEVNNLRNP